MCLRKIAAKFLLLFWISSVLSSQSVLQKQKKHSLTLVINYLFLCLIICQNSCQLLIQLVLLIFEFVPYGEGGQIINSRGDN